MGKRTHDGVSKRCDCGRRSWPKCVHPWHFRFYHGDREHRFSLDVIARIRGEDPPATLAEANAWRDRLRSEIRAGTLIDPHVPTKDPVAPLNLHLTFGDVCDQYLTRHVRNPLRRVKGKREMEILVAMLRRAEIPAAAGTTVRLEAKPMDAITRADVEAVRTWRRQEQAMGKSRRGSKGGEVGTNRLLSRLRHVFSWAIAEGHLIDTPFKRGPVAVVKMETSVEGARTRRLAPSIMMPDRTVQDGEEARLLKHAGSHLRALIIAALSTGARLGELLSLQWSQIRWDEYGQARWLLLPAAKTKTAEARVIPVGPKLRSLLALRRHAADGKVHAPDAYVFGNEAGERATSVRTAWKLACQRADIKDLHFHDLRREFASRLLESSADLHDVQMFLGHAAITTTSRYLQSTPVRLERALARMEKSARFKHGAGQPTRNTQRKGASPRPENARKTVN